MFNHNCEPNVSYCYYDDGGYLRLYAKRKIKKEKELFIGYTDVEDLTKAER
jgi:SET domain-containing protein